MRLQMFPMPKKKENVTMPVAFIEKVNELAAATHHGKRKWLVISAALAMYFRASEHDREEYVDLVLQADVRDAYEALTRPATISVAQVDATQPPRRGESGSPASSGRGSKRH